MQPGQEVFPEGQSRGRITIYCIAETLNRDLLSKKLRDRGPNFQLQVTFCMYICISETAEQGVALFWQDHAALKRPCQTLPPEPRRTCGARMHCRHTQMCCTESTRG